MAAAVGSRVGGPGRDGFSVHIFSPHLLVVVWVCLNRRDWPQPFVNFRLYPKYHLSSQGKVAVTLE